MPDLALHLCCSKCGSREIKIMLNVGELYLRTHGAGYVGGSQHCRGPFSAEEEST
jgi:hypothetical protein